MKRLLFILFLFPMLTNAGSILYTPDKVSEQPTFPGGEKALYDFINNYISYEACFATSYGEYPAVTAALIIDSAGAVHNLRCVDKLGTIFEGKVMEALQHMPQWNPARIDGKPVNISFILKINYTIPGTKVYKEEFGKWRPDHPLQQDQKNNIDLKYKLDPKQNDLNNPSRANLFVLITGFAAMLYPFSLAVLPAVLIIMLIFYLRRQRKINFKEILIYFTLGIVSIIPALAIETIFDFANFTTWKEIIVYSFVVVGLTEETGKFLFLRAIAYESKNFKEPYDGIIYAVLISMGFATAENLFYTYSGGTPTALMRMFTAVPAHAAFGVLMGFFTGLAKVRRFPVFYMSLGLLIAVFFHGLYDFFLMQNENPQLKALTIFFLIVSIYLSFQAIKIGSRYHVESSQTEIHNYESEYTKDGL